MDDNKQLTADRTEEVSKLVAHLFRHKAGQMVAVLTRAFGAPYLDVAEDIVQETLIRALQTWPFSGIPDHPGGWLFQVARNKALDHLRRQSKFREKAQQISQSLDRFHHLHSGNLTHEFQDDQLALMFLCCHPSLKEDVQIALILKTLCGFSVSEIARAFLEQEATIAQRLVRAKKKIRKEQLRFDLPDSGELPVRLHSLLATLYLLFNEGYAATSGENLIRRDLCDEAIRLSTLLVQHSAGNTAEVHALLALMLFQCARLPARINSNGGILLLEEQDRSLWDQDRIHSGFFHLDQAASGRDLTEYHLEAAIASCHAMAPDYESTDWERILSLYDSLLKLTSNPVVQLNRCVAIGMLRGAEAGLHELEIISKIPRLRNYYLLPATYARFYLRLGNPGMAARYYRSTLTLVQTDPERNFIRQKIKECEAKIVLKSSSYPS